MTSNAPASPVQETPPFVISKRATAPSSLNTLFASPLGYSELFYGAFSLGPRLLLLLPCVMRATVIHATRVPVV